MNTWAPPLAAYFARSGFELQQATRPSEGLARLREGGFDAAILDVMLPEMDGFELCRTIRKESGVPIIMLTARGDVMDRVVGLELGADDYLPKPFEPRELLARLQTILRRAAPGGGRRRAAAALRGPRDRPRPAQRAARRRHRGPHEHRVRAARAARRRAAQGLQPRRHPREAARPIGRDIHSRAVDILVSRLRRKLEPLDCIHTLRNAGYTFAGARLSRRTG